MKAIVADVAGAGRLMDKEGVVHDLDPSAWREADVRDTLVTGDGQHAWVAYRDDGRTVEVPPGTTYQWEIDRSDIEDLRPWADAADDLIAAMDGLGTDEERIFTILAKAASQPSAMGALVASFEATAGRTLRAALADELSGDELEKALGYLS